MHDGMLVIDADSHKMENPFVFFDYLPAEYRGRMSPCIDKYGERRLLIRDFNPRTGANDLERVFPQPEGAGKGAFAAIHPESAIGAVFNRIRLEHMDREGIDAQVIYGSMTLCFESILDPDLAIACMRAYNDYIADDCRGYAGKILPIGFVTLADVNVAVAEMRRCVHELGMIGIHVPPSRPVPNPAAPSAFPMVRLPKHLSHPDFDPILTEAERLDVALGVHGSPGVYLPSGIAEQVDSFILSHIFGHRNQMQMALSSCVFEGVFDRHPRLRIAFLEAGCGWVPDLVHAYHEHWEKRIRDFEPDVTIPPAAFAAEMIRERKGRSRAGLIAQTKQAVALWRRRKREKRVGDRDDFIFEHSNLDHDPVDFFRRGQIFTSFESDDPAPSYLKAALGEIGENIACFSADYGHWDGVVAGCVGNVVKAASYERSHLEKLLSGNCRRFYGARLEHALGETKMFNLGVR